MKFGFEKHVKTPEVKSVEIEKELTEEERQQKFEEECMVEADKLKVNLEELKRDIDAFGGEEKFKQYFEKATTFHGENEDGSKKVYANVAGDTQRDLERDIRWISSPATDAKIAAVFLGLTALLNMVNTDNAGFEIDHNGLIDSIRAIKEGTVQAGQYAQLTLGIITSSASVLFAKSGLSNYFESRKLKRQKKINDLKFKMTGVEVK